MSTVFTLSFACFEAALQQQLNRPEQALSFACFEALNGSIAITLTLSFACFEETRKRGITRKSWPLLVLLVLKGSEERAVISLSPLSFACFEEGHGVEPLQHGCS